MLPRRVDMGIAQGVRKLDAGDDPDGVHLRRRRVTVSGSFRKHIALVDGDREAFIALKAEVLSPPSAIPDSTRRGFTKLEGDPSHAPRTTEQRHLDAIGKSDLLWVVCPTGLPGPSTTMEIGYTLACGVPVLCANPIQDETLKAFVKVAPDPKRALAAISASRPNEGTTVLLHPKTAIPEIRGLLDELEYLLEWEGRPMSGPDSERATAAAQLARRMIERLGNLAR